MYLHHLTEVWTWLTLLALLACSERCTGSPLIVQYPLSLTGEPLPAAPPPLPATRFFTFPNGTNPENLAVRRNGRPLITINSLPLLYEIDPRRNQSGGILHRFAGVNSTFGITETEPDLFYIAAGNFSLATLTGAVGSWRIIEVDLRRHRCDLAALEDESGQVPSVQVRTVVEIPTAVALDGMSTINAAAGL